MLLLIDIKTIPENYHPQRKNREVAETTFNALNQKWETSLKKREVLTITNETTIEMLCGAQTAFMYAEPHVIKEILVKFPLLHVIYS